MLTILTDWVLVGAFITLIQVLYSWEIVFRPKDERELLELVGWVMLSIVGWPLSWKYFVQYVSLERSRWRVSGDA